MRYALPVALLVGCSGGDVFTRSPLSSGGTSSTGGSASVTGGSTASGGTGGAPDASLGGSVDSRDASPEAAAEAASPFAACPPAPPPSGSTCIGTLDCSYGDDPRVSCRVVHQCRSGRWLVSSKACTPLRFCSEYATAPVNGAPCTTRDEYCTFSVGDDCACVQGATLTWRCTPKPPAPCARRAENEGQPCGDAGGTCTYGFCGSVDRVQTACKDGAWSWSAPLCN